MITPKPYGEMLPHQCPTPRFLARLYKRWRAWRERRRMARITRFRRRHPAAAAEITRFFHGGQLGAVMAPPPHMTPISEKSFYASRAAGDAADPRGTVRA